MSDKEVIGLAIMVTGMGAVGGAGSTFWVIHAFPIGVLVVMGLGLIAAFIGGRMVVKNG